MISFFDLFKIGVGPSSSYTFGPMRAAAAFSSAHLAGGHRDRTSRLQVRLLGALAQNSNACASDRAVALGLAGFTADATDPDQLDTLWASIQKSRRLPTSDGREIDFDPARDIILDATATHPCQPNALRLTALAPDRTIVAEEVWHCANGGLIFRGGEDQSSCFTPAPASYPFWSATTLRDMCCKANGSIADVVRANELSLRDYSDLRGYLERIAHAMLASIDRGLNAAGELPGHQRVRRRARMLYDACCDRQRQHRSHTRAEVLSLVSTYAVAVSEESACGGRVVTAPTHSTAGIVPAVLRYVRDHCTAASTDRIEIFLLTATAIGVLFKTTPSAVALPSPRYKTAVACSMAAAGLAAAIGATYQQVENAAHLGITKCLSPVNWRGRGDAPFANIDDNARAALVALEAASLARHGDHLPVGSLDETIATMRHGATPSGTRYGTE